MDTKFSFTTIDNSDLDWDIGSARGLKFLAHLTLKQLDEEQDCIYIHYEYNHFNCAEDKENINIDYLGSLSIDGAKKLIRALQFMTEGK